MVKRTTNCIFCDCIVEGDFVETKADKILLTSHRILGTLKGILNGNPYTVYKNLSGQSQDSLNKFRAKIAGGSLYHFYCPNCKQSFDKVIY